MTRSRLIIILSALVAVPAAAAAGGSFFGASPRPCFSSGAETYRITASANADYTVRVDNDAAEPDLRLQMVARPDDADFVLMDDGDDAASCSAAQTIKTIRLDAGASHPNLTIALSNQGAGSDHKIFVRSGHFSEADAAALFAVIWKSAHIREARR
jgi:hypothetical protein